MYILCTCVDSMLRRHKLHIDVTSYAILMKGLNKMRIKDQ